MKSTQLKKWPIFSMLDPSFIREIHVAVVFGNLGDEALIVTNDDMVYALGNNTSGCLGTGDFCSILHPKKVEALCHLGITTFAYGSGPHVLALTKKGQIYSWGHNQQSQLGDGTYYDSCAPSHIRWKLSDMVVKSIACGSYHSLALTDKGEVYAWGQNQYGQTGSSTSSNQDTPRKICFPEDIVEVVHIACGHSSCMAVTNKGVVYSWGYNGVGQLGTGNDQNRSQPQEVSLDGIFIVKVVCGYVHTLALSDQNDLYVWGGNSYGQLGTNDKVDKWLPFRLPAREMGKVLDIAALHYSHISVAVEKSGRVFMWGQCRGQSVTVPTVTSLSHMHDVFAYYASPSVMHQPLILIKEENGERGIVECLTQAFDDPVTSDLIIQVQGKPIHVHKAILKIRCQYFKMMFQEHWIESNHSVIEHNQFSYDVYKAYLKYLYTDEVYLPFENTLELLDLANAHFEDKLKRRCAEIIKPDITVENVLFLYNTAIQYNVKELEDWCFTFALNHMTAVIKMLNSIDLDDKAFKAFIIKAACAGAFKT